MSEARTSDLVCAICQSPLPNIDAACPNCLLGFDARRVNAPMGTTSKPVVIAPQGNAGESPASTSSNLSVYTPWGEGSSMMKVEPTMLDRAKHRFGIDALYVPLEEVEKLRAAAESWESYEAAQERKAQMRQDETACAHDWVCLIGGIRCTKCGQQIAARDGEPRETAARLTDAQCDEVIDQLEAHEWTGLTRDNVRTWDQVIAEVRNSPEEPAVPTRHPRECDCHDCHYAKKHPQIPHHSLCGCWSCTRQTPPETNGHQRQTFTDHLRAAIRVLDDRSNSYNGPMSPDREVLLALVKYLEGSARTYGSGGYVNPWEESPEEPFGKQADSAPSDAVEMAPTPGGSLPNSSGTSSKYCGNWPCRLPIYHTGPCSSSPEKASGEPNKYRNARLDDEGDFR